MKYIDKHSIHKRMCYVDKQHDTIFFFDFNVLACLFFVLAKPRVFILLWRTYTMYGICIEPLNDNENRKGHSLEFIYPKYNTYTHTICVSIIKIHNIYRQYRSEHTV
jgi:hypothetical protein